MTAQITPTFADGPSRFLSSLGSKPAPRMDAAGGAVEVQRVRSELTSQVQALSTKQETQIQQLESQLNQLQQEMKPKMVNIERQQNSIQKQLDEIRQKVQKIGNDSLSPLQSQYDQLGVKFERFVRVDIEAKLKPMHDDLRQSKSKVDELVSSTTASFKRLNDQLRDITEKITATCATLQKLQGRTSIEIDELPPKINALEERVQQLKEMLEEAPIAAGPAGVEKQLQKVEASISRIEGELLPKQIEQANAPFIEGIRELGAYCEGQIVELQATQNDIVEANTQAEAKWKEAEEALETLMKESFDVQGKFAKLDQDTRTRLTTLQQNVESTVDALKAKLADIGEEHENGASSAEEQVREDVSALKNQVMRTVRELKESLKDATSVNQKKQQDALQRMSKIKNQLEGDGNALMRMKAIEEQVDTCVATLEKIHSERKKAQSEGITVAFMLARMEVLEARLESAEGRLSKKDEKPPAKKAKLTEGVEKIPPAPEEAGENPEAPAKAEAPKKAAEEPPKVDEEPPKVDEEPPKADEEPPKADEDEPAEKAEENGADE